MKNFSKGSILTIIASLVFGFMGPISAFAVSPLPVNLGDAVGFSLLSEAGITNVPTSIITGNVGTTPMAGSSIGLTCAQVTGTIYSVDATGPLPCRITNPSFLTTARGAMEAAYTDAYGRVSPAPVTELDSGLLSSTTPVFAAGIYKWSTDVSIVDTITLSGSAADIWIFQIAGNLTLEAKGDIGSGTKVLLAGGAVAKNVFWVVAGDPGVTLGTYSTFNGNILTLKDIIMNTGAVLNGRALAQREITLQSNTVTLPIGLVAAVSTARSRTATPVVPIVGLLKIPSPLALPLGAGNVVYNYTVWNVARLQQLVDVTVVDDKCSPVVLVSGDTNNNKFLDIDEKWKYTCSSMITATTTNTAIATAHSTDGFYSTAIATAIATVAVGSPLPPPLIHIVKVPNQLTPFPFGGGDVVYTYTVTNPGVVADKNVLVTDDKCSPVYFSSGDNNGNSMLDVNETWMYTCSANVKTSVGSVATAKGDANGLTALAYSFVNVLVSAPDLPQTGLPDLANISWTTMLLSGIIILLAISLAVVSRRKQI